MENFDSIHVKTSPLRAADLNSRSPRHQSLRSKASLPIQSSISPIRRNDDYAVSLLRQTRASSPSRQPTEQELCES